MPDADPNCIFCKVVAGELPSEQIDSDERTLTVMDINPATRGHAVVITRTHAENLSEVSDEDALAAMQAARRVVDSMRATLAPAGFNILHNIGRAAWQSIFHFHVHVIPGLEVDVPRRSPEPGELEEIAAKLR